MPRPCLTAALTLAAAATAIAVAAQPTSAAQVTAQPTIAAAQQTSEATRPTKVLIVMLENESRIHAIDGMPKLAAAAKTFGYATGYTAITHPSLPNYLAIAGGSTFGVHDDASPGSHALHGPSIFGQALAQGRTAKVYAESMPGNCAVNPATPYAVKHNPWAYFADPAERSACRKFDVPAGTTRSGALHADIAAGDLPTVGMLVPNLCDDAHDCPLGTADNWLSPWLRQLEAGADWKAGRLSVLVTFDEDDYSEANHVLTVVLSPGVHGQTVSAPLNHFSLTRYADELTGSTPLRNAAGATSLSARFPGI